jgi:hypothetical protein
MDRMNYARWSVRDLATQDAEPREQVIDQQERQCFTVREPAQHVACPGYLTLSEIGL